MWSDPKSWVAVSFVAFVVLFGRTIWRALAKMLDNQRATIVRELDTAAKLRQEAEETLALYTRKYKESMQEAETIVARARDEAKRMLADAEKDLKADLDARTKNAMEKIAQEEKRAIEEVRNHVVDITISAAKKLITEQLGNMTGDDMIRHIASDIERKVH